MSKRVALVVGGLSAIAAGVAALFVAKRTTTTVKDAVSGASPAAPPGATNSVRLHLTGYWPFQEGLTAKERKMEGAPVDRKGRPLTTVEQHLADPANTFVSLSGDPDIFPYGQKMLIPWGDKTVVGRVTDTGSHFHGLGKVFRVAGAEPIDVCVASSSTIIPKKTVDARVVVGDHLDKASKTLALEKAGKSQSVVGCGFDYLGAEV